MIKWHQSCQPWRDAVLSWSAWFILTCLSVFWFVLLFVLNSTGFLWCVSEIGGRTSWSSLCFFIFLCYKNNFILSRLTEQSCAMWVKIHVICGWRYMRMCTCVCAYICIWSIPPLSPEIKQSRRPLQCTKSSCSSDTCVKQATSISSPKKFSVPLDFSSFWEASRGEIHVTKRHPSFAHLIEGISFRFLCQTHQQNTKLLLSLFSP